MNPLHRLARRLRALFRRKSIEAEMAEEMRFHLEERAADHVADGLPLDEARYAAQRKFGNVGLIKETARDLRGWLWLEQLLQDLRFAVRSLRKTPGFTAVAVLTLALGIGVNTSMFTGFQATLLREQPYPDAERLVRVFRTSPQSQRWPHSPANFLEQQADNQVFERVAAVAGRPLNLAEPGQPAERVRGLQISADYFPLLGIEPELGRTFTAAEDHPGQNAVAVLSHAFWLRRFAGDPTVLGRTLRLDGESVTIVGVMPARFRDRMLWGTTDVWRPIAFTDADRRNRDGNYLDSIARLKPGVSLAQAQAAMDLLAARQARDRGEPGSGIGLRVVSFASSMPARGQLIVWLTMVLAGFVLLIACANLANLQFARTSVRTHELAIRGALGAARGRLLRQLLTESLVLAAAGGLLGVALALGCNQLLSRRLVDAGEPILPTALNLTVLGFAFIVATISGLAFGLIPAWLATRTDLNGALKQGSRGTTADRSQHRVQHALIVIQVALALVLLTGAGMVARGLHRFTVQDPGWRPEGLTMGHLSLPERKYRTDAQQFTFTQRLRETLAALPGVERAAIAWSVPVSPFNVEGNFVVEGRPAPSPGRAPLRFVDGVTPGYFETLGMRVLAGRDFTDNDGQGHPAVVIINETMARTFWPGVSPLGQRLDQEEIVGVVSDVSFPADPSEPQTRFQTYRPLSQAPRNYLVIVVRGNIAAETLRRTVSDLDADLPVNEPGPATAAIGRALGNLAVSTGLFSAFAALGLLLALLGLYGVIAGFVARRSNEIGIRMALGAKLGDVLWLVIGKGLRLTLLGVGIGLIGAVGLARLLGSLAPALDATDPLPIAALTLLLVAVALIACYLPARRAAKIDPIIALRAE